MTRQIEVGTFGAVSTHPLGYLVGDPAQSEIAIPIVSGFAGEAPAPKNFKRGQNVEVGTPDGLVSYRLTRWRGMVQVRGADGAYYQVRVKRDTRAAAEAAAADAARAKLGRLAESERALLEADQDAQLTAAEGDVVTTVLDLVDRAMSSPSRSLKIRTRQNNRTARARITECELAGRLPRSIEPGDVAGLLEQVARQHGSTAAFRVRALLAKAFDLAVARSSVYHVRVNVVRALPPGSVPAHPRVVDRGIDHETVPSDQDVELLLAALQADPLSLPMSGKRNELGGGNGSDVADLLTFVFRTGTRIGEAAALRWCDLDLPATGIGWADVSATLVRVPGGGVQRQERSGSGRSAVAGTKTAKGTRQVALREDLVALLRARARLFDVELEEQLPVFPSPQRSPDLTTVDGTRMTGRHDKWRDTSNLHKAVRAAFKRHGMPEFSSHVARRWRITNLLDQQVPASIVADHVGHTRIEQTLSYAGRQRTKDERLLRAL